MSYKKNSAKLNRLLPTSFLPDEKSGQAVVAMTVNAVS